MPQRTMDVLEKCPEYRQSRRLAGTKNQAQRIPCCRRNSLRQACQFWSSSVQDGDLMLANQVPERSGGLLFFPCRYNPGSEGEWPQDLANRVVVVQRRPLQDPV